VSPCDRPEANVKQITAPSSTCELAQVESNLTPCHDVTESVVLGRVRASIYPVARM
jgi:hypothetical protein